LSWIISDRSGLADDPHATGVGSRLNPKKMGAI
jgi:hypothetical protein